MLSAANNWSICILAAFSIILSTVATCSTRAAAPVSPVVPAYQLHVGDQLSIGVMGHDDYTRQVTILSDGTFQYPIVGTVHASGLTVTQLTATLVKGLSDELNQPQLTISVTQSLAQTVSVLGAVDKAGAYPIAPDWRLVDALAAAGGLTAAPEMTTITVVRTGSLTPYSIDTARLMSGQDATQNMSLLPGDTVLVQQRDQSSTNVQVTGEVKLPGSYTVPEKGVTPLAAIIAAGGVTSNAALSQSQLLHDGTARTVDLRYILTDLSDAPSDTTLYPGDSLLIPAISKKVSVLGDVNSPATYNIPDGKSITVTQAVGMASGTEQGANLAKVTILRDVDGKPSVLAVNLDRIYSGDSAANDVPIEPGDVIYVPAKAPRQYRPQDLVLLAPFLQLMHL